MLCHVQFHSLFNFTQKLTPEIGVEFEKQPLYTPPLGVEISCKAFLLFKIFCGHLYFDALIIGFC